MYGIVLPVTQWVSAIVDHRVKRHSTQLSCNPNIQLSLEMLAIGINGMRTRK